MNVEAKRDTPELLALERELLRQRSALIQDMESRTTGIRSSSPSHASDVADMAGGEPDITVLVSARRAELDRLAQIDDALSRLEYGAYGICETCGNAIDTERLLALPYATMCLACQEEEDRTDEPWYESWAFESDTSEDADDDEDSDN